MDVVQYTVHPRTNVRHYVALLNSRGEVEDTPFQGKAKDSKKLRGQIQGPTF